MTKADAAEVEFSGGERSATRFANSNITANIVQFDQSLTVTVYNGSKSGSVHDARVRRRGAEGDGGRRADQGADGAREARRDAAHRRAAGLHPGRRGAARHGRTSVRPSARKMVKPEPRHLREEGRRSAPATFRRPITRPAAPTRKGLFAYYQYGRGRLHPDLPHQRRRRLGLGRASPARKDVVADRRRRSSPRSRPTRRRRARSRARSSRAATR